MRHVIIHAVAWALGLLVHIDGLPYGRAPRQTPGVDGKVSGSSAAE